MHEVARFCGKCDCGCPALYVDATAPPERRIVMTDDFGGSIAMSTDQWASVVEAARDGIVVG